MTKSAWRFPAPQHRTRRRRRNNTPSGERRRGGGQRRRGGGGGQEGNLHARYQTSTPPRVFEVPIRGGGLGNVRTPVVKSAIAERAPWANSGARARNGSREGSGSVSRAAGHRPARPGRAGGTEVPIESQSDHAPWTSQRRKNGGRKEHVCIMCGSFWNHVRYILGSFSRTV